MRTFSLERRTAFISGAAGLLGRQHSIAICEAGGDVVVVDRDLQRLRALVVQLSGMFPERRIMHFDCDVSDELAVSEMKACLEKDGIHPSILINNAAPNPKPIGREEDVDNSFENYSLSRWNLEIRDGLASAFVCSKIFGAAMVNRAEGGSIINIASDLSVIAPDNRIYSTDDMMFDARVSKPVTYSVSKTALVGLTRYLATYWARHRIRVNSLSPGGVINNQDPDFVSRLENRIPLGRMAKDDEYRGAIVFLASDASSYLTGQNVVMDGGRSVW